jgi:membrane protease YdiL (CAAX protease family)
MMQGNLQQNTTPEAVPWTIGDIVKGSLVAIGIMIAIGVVLGIGMILLVGVNDLQTLVSQHLTSTELLKQIVKNIEAKGRLNSTLAILFILMTLGEGAIPLGAWLFSIRKYRCTWESLGFRKFDVKKGLLLAILITGIGIGISIGYEILLQRLGYDTSADPYYPFNVNGIGITFFSIIAVLAAPIAEETFFRGFMFQGIRKRIGFAWAAIISAAIFAIAHLSTESLVPIFLLGLMLAWLYHKTKSIWPCIIVHAVYNSIGVISMIKS